MAIPTPDTDTLVIHHADTIFQITVARKTCPQRETPGKLALNFTKKSSISSNGTKATNNIHPGKPSHGKLSKTPDSADNNSRCIRFNIV